MILKALKSKTIWFNIINLALFGFETYSGIYIIDPKLHAFIVTIGNGLLRFVTNKPLNEK